jgi:crotonobetainyl-CoA:carnitine CoA-transferase CaiB-like acyl-CoA transferase
LNDLQPRSLKVLDFSTHLSGSVATRILASLGATVVKMEHPKRGDGNRFTEPEIQGEALFHLVLNAEKRSAAFDRRSPEWPAVFAASAKWADVVVVGGSPSEIERRGLDFDAFREANDEIVHCLITGYGERGPWSEVPSHGLNTDALAGLVPLARDDNGMWEVRSDYRSYGTTLAGFNAAIGILEGVRRKNEGLRAQEIAVSIWESAMFWQWRDVSLRANGQGSMTAYRDLGARYGVYLTADELPILVCPIEKKFWEKFCELTGLGHAFASKGSWSRNGMDYGKDDGAERQSIAECIRQQPLAHWVEAFEESGVPYSAIYELDEALASLQATAMEILIPMRVADQTIQIPRVPIRVAGQPPVEEATLPGLGEFTDTFLAQLFPERMEATIANTDNPTGV